MSKSHPRWRLAKKILTWLFFIAVAVLLVVYAQKVDWEEVWKVIRNYNRTVLLGAVGLVIVSYLMYGCYDLLGRAYCGHKLAKRQVMLVSFICYAFNLTLSTWVGGIGMRYRLYSRLGLPGGTITRIFSLSITTNWLGYILLGGVIFTIGVVQLPAHWYIDEATLRILGIVLLLIIAASFWSVIRNRIGEKKWLLRTALYGIPLPWIAIESGWFVAEYGRQPWAIGEVLPTAVANSSLTAGDLIFSMLLICGLYTLFLVAELFLMFKFARLGPSSLKTGRYHYEQSVATTQPAR